MRRTRSNGYLQFVVMPFGLNRSLLLMMRDPTQPPETVHRVSVGLPPIHFMHQIKRT